MVRVGARTTPFHESATYSPDQRWKETRSWLDLLYARAESSRPHSPCALPPPSPAAFEALFESVRRYELTAVVLPSLLHFAVLGASHDIRDSFERATGARVLLLDSP